MIEILTNLHESIHQPGVLPMMLAIGFIGFMASAVAYRKGREHGAYEGVERGAKLAWEAAENEYRVVPLHPAVV